jgi:hypothetical protein
VVPPDSGVMKTAPANEVSDVLNKQRLTERFVRSAMSNRAAEKISNFSERAFSELGK